MGDRLDFLRRPMSQWLSGVDEATFRKTAPRWLARFKCNNCQPIEFDDRFPAVSNDMVESILPTSGQSEDLLAKLQKIGLEPERYNRLKALVRRLLELNRKEIGPIRRFWTLSPGSIKS